MDSQKTLACYPQRTFYSLSDSFSMQNYRITMTDVNLCLIRLSYSQVIFTITLLIIKNY